MRAASGEHELVETEWALATIQGHGDVAKKDEVTKTQGLAVCYRPWVWQFQMFFAKFLLNIGRKQTDVEKESQLTAGERARRHNVLRTL